MIAENEYDRGLLDVTADISCKITTKNDPLTLIQFEIPEMRCFISPYIQAKEEKTTIMNFLLKNCSYSQEKVVFSSRYSIQRNDIAQRFIRSGIETIGYQLTYGSQVICPKAFKKPQFSVQKESENAFLVIYEGT